MNENNHPFGPGSRSPLADQREMPACYPIKGNVDSMKYHRPDSQGYEQTKAEVWFDSPSAAEAAGFALAGSHPDGADASVFEPGGSQHPCDAATVNANRSAAMGAGTSGEITVDGNSTIENPGLSGGAKAAGAAGIAGVAGAAGLAAAGGKDALGNVAGAAGDMGGKVAGAAGDMGGKVTGAAGDMGGKVTGAAGTLGGKATAAGAGLGAAAAGVASTGRDKVTVGGASASGAVSGGSLRSDLHDDNYDDDDGAGLAGCLRKWWWLLALLLGIIILGLLLSQCNFGDDDDGDAAPVADTTTTTEVEEEEEVEEEVVEETTTTTEAPETTTTTEAPPEVLNLAGVAAGASPTVVGVLGPLGLNDVLSADGPFTVFLPSDAGAVAVLDAQPDLITSVTDDPLLAQSVLGFHVVPGTFTAADLADGATLVTSTGLELTVADGAVNGVEISSVDLEASNGVIHVIEGILFPPAEPQLAVTGASSEVLGAIGAALLLTGGAFVVTSRRREDDAA